MTVLFLVSLVIIALLVVGASVWAHRAWGTAWTPLVIRGLALVPIAFLLSWGFSRLAQNARLQFEETLHGYELAAQADTIRCSRDGPCRYSYQCDPYTVRVSYQDCTTDSKGNRRCTTKYRSETRYHDCPYCTYEVRYGVRTTLGTFGMGTTLPAAPNSERWRWSERVPSSLPSGDPAPWQAARTRELAFRPGAVAEIRTYENYLLASEHTVLRRWSDRVRALDSAGALPALMPPITGHYEQARVVAAPALKRTVSPVWDLRTRLLAASLGTLRQGSFLLVLVPATPPRLSLSPTDYTTAIQAHWQDEGVQGRRALPKNLVAVVLGLEGDTVRWGRVVTGMPDGNDALKAEARVRLTNQPFDPDVLLGRPVITPATSPLADSVRALATAAETSPTDSGARSPVAGAPAAPSRGAVLPPGVFTQQGTLFALQQGLLPDLLFGYRDPSTAFVRTSMTGKSGKGTGYAYLKEEIRPTTAGWAGSLAGTVFGLALAWWALLAIFPPAGVGGHWGIPAHGVRFGRR